MNGTTLMALKDLLVERFEEPERERVLELLAGAIEEARAQASAEAQGRAIVAGRFAEIARKFPT